MINNDGDLNPEVQNELETLNSSSLEINELENKLQFLRHSYNETLSKWTTYLSEVSSKVGKSIPKARPYFDLKKQGCEVQKESQRAAIKYETAYETLVEAKEIIAKTESVHKLDDTTMEILNRATHTINRAKIEMEESHKEHEFYLKNYMDLDSQINEFEKKYKTDIKKSKQYFSYSACMEEQLKNEKMNIESNEEKVKISKCVYNKALQNLENISNTIHNTRKIKDLGPRGECVGAETPHLSCFDYLNNSSKNSSLDRKEYCARPETTIHEFKDKNNVVNVKRKGIVSTPIVNVLLQATTKMKYNIDVKTKNIEGNQQINYYEISIFLVFKFV